MSAHRNSIKNEPNNPEESSQPQQQRPKDKEQQDNQKAPESRNRSSAIAVDEEQKPEVTESESMSKRLSDPPIPKWATFPSLENQKVEKEAPVPKESSPAESIVRLVMKGAEEPDPEKPDNEEAKFLTPTQVDTPEESLQRVPSGMIHPEEPPRLRMEHESSTRAAETVQSEPQTSLSHPPKQPSRSRSSGAFDSLHSKTWQRLTEKLSKKTQRSTDKVPLLLDNDDEPQPEKERHVSHKIPIHETDIPEQVVVLKKPNEYSNLLDSDSTDTLLSSEGRLNGCCSCFCSTNVYEMASEFTNKEFRDGFILKILKYKIMQMSFIFLVAMIFHLILCSRTKGPWTEELLSPRTVLLLVLLKINIYILVLAIVRYCHIGRTKKASWILFVAMTLTLCVFSTGLIFVLGTEDSIIVTTVTGTVLSFYFLVYEQITRGTLFCCKTRLDFDIMMSSNKIYLHIIPLITIAFLGSIFTVLGTTVLLDLILGNNDPDAHLFHSEHTIMNLIISYAFAFGIIELETCRLRSVISGGQVPLDKYEELFASFFV